MKTQLGVKVADRITGFSGIVTGRVEYITGCNQCLVAPRVKEDGALIDSQWIDEQRLEVTNPTPVAIAALDNTENPGADKAAPRR